MLLLLGRRGCTYVSAICCLWQWGWNKGENNALSEAGSHGNSNIIIRPLFFLSLCLFISLTFSLLPVWLPRKQQKGKSNVSYVFCLSFRNKLVDFFHKWQFLVLFSPFILLNSLKHYLFDILKSNFVFYFSFRLFSSQGSANFLAFCLLNWVWTFAFLLPQVSEKVNIKKVTYFYVSPVKKWSHMIWL